MLFAYYERATIAQLYLPVSIVAIQILIFNPLLRNNNLCEGLAVCHTLDPRLWIKIIAINPRRNLVNCVRERSHARVQLKTNFAEPIFCRQWHGERGELASHVTATD